MTADDPKPTGTTGADEPNREATRAEDAAHAKSPARAEPADSEPTASTDSAGKPAGDAGEAGEPTEQGEPGKSGAPSQAQQPKKPRVHPREAIKQFEAAWPEAFSSDPKQVKPLAIGILQQILADRPAELDGLNSKAIRAAMKFYTSRLSYHIAMKNAEHRVDLKGEPAEPVDDKARAHAEEQIKAIHAARDARRAEQGETEDGGEKKPRRPRKAAGKGARKAAKGGQGDKAKSGQEGSKRRGSRQPNKSGSPRHSEQPDPALKNLSMEEKLDRLAQRFGQDGVK